MMSPIPINAPIINAMIIQPQKTAPIKALPAAIEGNKYFLCEDFIRIVIKTITEVTKPIIPFLSSSQSSGLTCSIASVSISMF